MKRISAIAAVALLAACGSDDDGKGGKGAGGSGGGGGGGGGEPTVRLLVTNEAGTTFVGESMTVTIQQKGTTDAVTPLILAELELWEDTDGDGLADGDAFYDLELQTTRQALIDGELESSGLVTQAPDQPGRGKVEVKKPEGGGEFGAATDAIKLQLAAGTVTGSVTSSKPNVASTLAGSYTLSCEFLEGGSLVADADFKSEFCKQFAHQRPAVD